VGACHQNCPHRGRSAEVTSVNDTCKCSRCYRGRS
jgi:hypothetical protein